MGLFCSRTTEKGDASPAVEDNGAEELGGGGGHLSELGATGARNLAAAKDVASNMPICNIGLNPT